MDIATALPWTVLISAFSVVSCEMMLTYPRVGRIREEYEPFRHAIDDGRYVELLVHANPE